MPPRGDLSLGGRRTGALRGAFMGLVRNTALSPAQQQVLATNTLERQPLSENERNIAVSFIAPMLNTKWPNAPAGEIQATALETADKLTRRDLAALVQAVRLKGTLTMASNQPQRLAQDADRLNLDALEEEERAVVDQLQTPWTSSPPDQKRKKDLQLQLARIQQDRAGIYRRRRVTTTPAAPAPAGGPKPPGAADYGFTPK